MCADLFTAVAADLVTAVAIDLITADVCRLGHR